MDLEKFLNENHIWHKFVEKPETIHTKDAAEVSGIKLEQITKSLILTGPNEEIVLAIIPGDRKLKMSVLEKLLNIKKLKLVPFEKAEAYSGYLPGATPPIGHKKEILTILDCKLMEYETIFGGGGTRDKLIELKTKDVIKINKAIVSEITL